MYFRYSISSLHYQSNTLGNLLVSFTATLSWSCVTRHGHARDRFIVPTLGGMTHIHRRPAFQGLPEPIEIIDTNSRRLIIRSVSNIKTRRVSNKDRREWRQRLVNRTRINIWSFAFATADRIHCTNRLAVPPGDPASPPPFNTQTTSSATVHSRTVWTTATRIKRISSARNRLKTV